MSGAGDHEALTAARRRVLGKALARGRVMAAGGFGGDPWPLAEVLRNSDFDRPHLIEELWRQGLLEPAEGANSWRATEAGRRAAAGSRAKAG